MDQKIKRKKLLTLLDGSSAALAAGSSATEEVRGWRWESKGPGRAGNPPSPLKATAPPAWELRPRVGASTARKREGGKDGWRERGCLPAASQPRLPAVPLPEGAARQVA